MGGHFDEIAQRVVKIGIAMVLVMSLAACGRRHPASVGDAACAGWPDMQLLARAAGARRAAEIGGQTLYVAAVFAGPHGMAREDPEPFDSMTQRRLSEAFVAGGAGQSVLFEPRAEGDSQANRVSHPRAVAIADIAIRADSGFVDILLDEPGTIPGFISVTDLRYVFVRRERHWDFVRREWRGSS